MQINILLKILKFNFIIGKKILLKNIKIGITKLVRNRFDIIIINEILQRKIWNDIYYMIKKFNRIFMFQNERWILIKKMQKVYN